MKKKSRKLLDNIVCKSLRNVFPGKVSLWKYTKMTTHCVRSRFSLWLAPLRHIQFISPNNTATTLSVYETVSKYITHYIIHITVTKIPLFYYGRVSECTTVQVITFIPSRTRKVGSKNTSIKNNLFKNNLILVM